MSDIHFLSISDIIQKLVSTNAIYATVCSKPKRFEFTYHFKPERNPGTALSVFIIIVKPDNDSYRYCIIMPISAYKIGWPTVKYICEILQIHCIKKINKFKSGRHINGGLHCLY